MTNSWWIDLSDEAFTTAARREWPRMRESKIGKWQAMGYEQWPSPPRRTNPHYTYALEQRRIEAA
jgi:hypothetical protein